MRLNPAADWTVKDVETLCRQHGLTCIAPKRGSHFKVSHPAQDSILTIPYRRPIKSIYIRTLVKFVDVVEG